MKLGFSNRMFLWSMIIFGVWLFVITYLMAFLKVDLIGLAGLVVGLMGTLIGFQYNKTKVENIHKIQNNTNTDATITNVDG